MEQRLSLITLGVNDVGRARTFYEALGWQMDGGVDNETDHVAFFQAGGMILALWDRAKLAGTARSTDGGGWGGVTLALQRQLARPGGRGDRGGARGRGHDRPRPARRRSGAATRGSSSIPTGTRGRSPTTRTGRCTRTAGPRSPEAAPVSEVLWTPPADVRQTTQLGRFLDFVRDTRGKELPGLRRAVRVVGVRPRGLLGLALGLLRRPRARRRTSACSARARCPAPSGSPARGSTTPSTCWARRGPRRRGRASRSRRRASRSS